jgi:lipopolysaccharide/colanic/teichoic acid biosynthesis glycosyltransferase
MDQQASHLPLSGDPFAGTEAEFTPAQPLERRRLQCYLAIMLADIAALFFSFRILGSLYLGESGIAQASSLAQLLLPVFLTIALYNGAYSLATLENARAGAVRALTALAIGAAVVVFIAFYTKSSAEFSRFLFTGGVLASGLVMAWLRLQMRAFVAWRCGSHVINELVISDGGPRIDLPGAQRVDAKRLGLSPALDNPQALNRIGQVLFAVDRVVVSCPASRRLAWATILKGANIEGEVVDDAVADLGAHGARIAAGHGLLRVSVGPLGMRARAAKRLFDVVLATAGLVALSPLLLLVTVAILLEDGSPVLFVQRRVGRGNRFFTMVKFRSMRVAAADREGQTSAQRDDDRTTRVGALIRRTSIDELPQLINVLKGEMSIVGPRPHALGSQAGTKLFWEVDQRYWTRHALKPGLTGLAQVRGLRGATDHEADLSRRLVADLEYVDGWSLGRDVRIVLRTLGVLVHDRAF